MARDFDGVDDVIQYADATWEEFSSSESYSICCWVRHDSITGIQCYARKTHTTTLSIYLFRKSDTDVLQWQGGTIAVDLQTLNGSTVLSASTWYFVAFVRNVGTDTVKLYRGGVAEDVIEEATATDTTTTGHGVSTGAFFVGSGEAGDDEEMTGAMANFQLWRRALTLDDLRQIKRLGVPSLTSLELWLPLWGTVSPEPDFSGNNRHGTVTGAVAADHPPGISSIWLASQSRRFWSSAAVAAQNKMKWLIGGGVGGRSGANLRAGVIG